MVCQHTHGGFQYIQLHIQKICILHAVRRSQHTSSGYLPFPDVGQVHCHTLSCITSVLILSVYLNAADLAGLSNRIYRQHIFPGNNPGQKGSGNNRPKACQRKHPVNGEPWDRSDVLFLHLIPHHVFNQRYQLIQPLSCGRRNSRHRRAFQKGSRQLLLYFLFHQLQPVLIHKVTFVKYDNALFHS